MKIFGFTIGRKDNTQSTQQKIIDVVEVKDIVTQEPELPTKTISEIPFVPNPTFIHSNHWGMVARPNQTRSFFEPTEYDLYEIGRIEDSIAGERCTVIRDSSGYISVLSFEDLYAKFDKISCNDHILDPGIETLTLFEGKPSWKPVKQIIRHRVSKDGFTIYQKHGFTRVTNDHSLIIQDNLEEVKPSELNNKAIAKVNGHIPRNNISDINLIDISEFAKNIPNTTVNDKTIVYKYIGSGKQKGIIRELSINRYQNLNNLLPILGAFIAEGSTKAKKDSRQSFRIASGNKSWLDELQVYFNNMFGDISIIYSEDSGMNHLTCNRELIACIFANMAGIGSSHKKIPNFIFNISEKYINILIKWMVDGDGHRNAWGWGYTSASVQLISGYSTLLRILNIKHSFNYRINHGRTYYTIRTNLYYEKRHKTTRLEKCRFENEYVYDLEVADSHMFVDAAGHLLLHNTEAYVRQAFKKQTGLFLKEGFDYVGSNKKIANYIKTRFAQIERATNIPHEELIRRLVGSFVRKSNAFLIKVRKESASGGKAHPDKDGIMRQPIAGYYPMPPEMLKLKSDGSGKPVVWRQQLPHGIWLDFDPADIVHIHFDRKEGFLFGTPLIQPVIDDIRALRKIEENIELLIYKHLFPLFQYIVGTDEKPAGVTEDGHREIDVARFELQAMPTEGGIVTPERHEIKAIGSENKALRAEHYLSHFKTRVFSGLGMSAVDFGEPDTSNKSTADNMSRALIDNIKDLQESFEAQFNTYVVNELLEESTFDEEIFAPENIVKLEFREIDIDKQIKVENQAADLFNKNAITWDEMRRDLGRDPIKIPDDPEMQDHSQYPEWFNTHWKLFQEPEKLINAGDESYTALALAKTPSSSITSQQVQQSQTQEQDNQMALVKAKAAAKPAASKDNFLTKDYGFMKEVVLHEVSEHQVSIDHLKQKLLVSAGAMSKTLRSHMNTAFLSGLGQYADSYLPKIQSARNQIHDRSDLLIKKLMYDILSLVKYKVDSNPQNVKISTVHSIFDSFKYRIDFITKAEVVRANNLGKIIKVAELGAIKGKYIIQEQTCDTCKGHASTEVYLHGYDLNTVPPHHPNCECGLQISEVKNT